MLESPDVLLNDKLLAVPPGTTSDSTPAGIAKERGFCGHLTFNSCCEHLSANYKEKNIATDVFMDK